MHLGTPLGIGYPSDLKLGADLAKYYSPDANVIAEPTLAISLPDCHATSPRPVPLCLP